MRDGRDLVDSVRHAALAHSVTWEAMVPDQFTVNFAAEAAEEAAYAEMARRKRALRDHICETYGISIRELTSLAMP
jgi:hypothetical protein